MLLGPAHNENCEVGRIKNLLPRALKHHEALYMYEGWLHSWGSKNQKRSLLEQIFPIFFIAFIIAQEAWSMSRESISSDVDALSFFLIMCLSDLDSWVPEIYSDQYSTRAIATYEVVLERATELKTAQVGPNRPELIFAGSRSTDHGRHWSLSPWNGPSDLWNSSLKESPCQIEMSFFFDVLRLLIFWHTRHASRILWDFLESVGSWSHPPN